MVIRCIFCGSRGCLACAGDIERQRKETEEPIFVASTPHDMELLKQFMGRQALEKANSSSTLHQHDAITPQVGDGTLSGAGE
jgi:hypothetical protein